MLLFGVAWVTKRGLGDSGAEPVGPSGGGRGPIGVVEPDFPGTSGPGQGEAEASTGGGVPAEPGRVASEAEVRVELSGKVFGLRGELVRNGLVWIEVRDNEGRTLREVAVREGKYLLEGLPATKLVLHSDRNLFESLHEPIDLRGAPERLEHDLVVAVPWELDVHVEVPDPSAGGEPDPHWDANTAFALMGHTGCAPVARAKASGRTVGTLTLRERDWREFLDGELTKAGTLRVAARPPIEVSVEWAEGTYGRELVEDFQDRVSFVIDAGELLRFGGLRARFLREGEPVVGQPVQLVSDHGALGVLTDEEGRVWFSMVTVGEHDLRLGRSAGIDPRTGERFGRTWPGAAAPLGRFGRVDPGPARPVRSDSVRSDSDHSNPGWAPSAEEGIGSLLFGPRRVVVEDGQELDLGDLDVELGRSIQGRFTLARGVESTAPEPGIASCWLEVWNAADPGEPRLDNVLALGFESEFRIEGLGARHHYLRVRSSQGLARRREGGGPHPKSWGHPSDFDPEFTGAAELCDLTHGSLSGVELKLVPSVALVLSNPPDAEGPASFEVFEAESGVRVGEGRVLRAATVPLRLAPGAYRLEWTLANGAPRATGVRLEDEVTRVSPPK